MIDVVENKEGGVVWCRVVYMHAKGAISNWNVFKFIDKLQMVACQQAHHLQQYSLLGAIDQGLCHHVQGYSLA